MAATAWRCFLVHVAVIHFLPVLQAANVASGKTVTMSSLAPHWNRAASLAVDGNTNTDFYAGSCVATAEQTDPWLRVDLGRNYLVTSVKLYLLSTDLFYVYLDQTESPESGVKIGSEKTFDECLELCRQDTANDCRQFVRRNWEKDNCWRVTTERKNKKDVTYTQNKGRALANLKISVSNTVSETKSACRTVTSPIESSSALTYSCTQPVSGRYVWLTVDGENKILSLCEVEVDGALPYMTSNPTYKLVTSQGFTVEWAACQFAESSQSTNRYKVEHTKKGSGTWYSYDVTGTSTTFTGRQHNTQYTVRVRCYWKDDKGVLQLADAYKEITIKTICKNPVQVTIDEVTPTLAGQKPNPRADVALAWQPISNTDSGCDQITRYDVQYSKTGSSAWTTALPSAGTSTSTVVITITDLEFNTQYKVRVKATNNHGKSSLGAEREATTKEGWSSAVQYLQHVAQSDSLSVSWQHPTHPRGIITGYKLSYQRRQYGMCPRANSLWTGPIVVTSRSHKLTGLHTYSEYRVKVVPVNGAGDGVQETMDWRTASIVPSSAPTNVRIKAKTARLVTFEWTAVSCEKINGVLRYYGYTLQGIEKDSRKLTGTSYDVSWTRSDLVPYALYIFTVTAVNYAGSSAQSDTVQVRTDQASSSAVRSLQHVAQTDSLRVAWQPPAHPNGIITDYKVSYQLRQRGTCQRVGGQWSGAKLVTSLNHDLTGLNPYSEYRVRVVPVNGAGDGAEATMNLRTASTVPSSPTLSAHTNAKTAQSVTFGWTAVSCDKINDVSVYYVYTLQGIEYDNRTWTGTSHDVTLTALDLMPYALYSFTVTAVNNAGSNARSDVIRVRTDEAACAGGPCQNGGKCVGFVDGSRCVCRAAYTGRSCEKPATMTCTGNKKTKCAALPISAVKVTTP